MTIFDPTDPRQVRAVLDLIEYDERYQFLVRTRENAYGIGPAAVGIELQVRRPDAITGEPGVGYGGVRRLSPHASRSDVVRTAFGAVLAYNEHETREFFRYRGAQIFGPHGDVEALVQAAQVTDYVVREVS